MKSFLLTVFCLLSVSALSASANCLTEEEHEVCHQETDAKLLDERQLEFVLEDLDAVIDAATIEVDSGVKQTLDQPEKHEKTFVADTVDQF